MKDCNKIWGKLEENRDDGQYRWGGLYCPPVIPAELGQALVDFRGRMAI